MKDIDTLVDFYSLQVSTYARISGYSVGKLESIIFNMIAIKEVEMNEERKKEMEEIIVQMQELKGFIDKVWSARNEQEELDDLWRNVYGIKKVKV